MTDQLLFASLAVAGWAAFLGLGVLYYHTWKKVGEWRFRNQQLHRINQDLKQELDRLTRLDEEDEPTDPGIPVWTARDK